MTALLDTGFLLAVIDADDGWHQACVAALQSEPVPYLPEVILPELAYLVLRELGYPALLKFLRAVVDGELPLLQTEPADLDRAVEILGKYADSRVDYVDCMLVAMAERLNLTRIMTVDRRHFNLFRPKHCNVFELVP